MVQHLYAQIEGEPLNQVDGKGLKYGFWIEQMPGVRGEKSFSWEGRYRDGKKNGVWKKYTNSGDLKCSETFKNDMLDGPAKYYNHDGKVVTEGSYLAITQASTTDSVRMVDPQTGVVSWQPVPVQVESVKNGLWTVYDDEGKNPIREYYKRGELAPEGMPNIQDTTPTSSTPKQKALPHEMAAPGKKKKG